MASPLHRDGKILSKAYLKRIKNKISQERINLTASGQEKKYFPLVPASASEFAAKIPLSDPVSAENQLHQNVLSSFKLKKENEVLNDLFYKPSSSASYSAPIKLYHAAKEILPTITLSMVRKWLSRQPAYAMYRVNHQTFERRKVVVPGVRHQFQADLMDMTGLSRENDGNKFLLTVIDCFSRLAAVVPIKSKHAVNVVQAMGIAFERLGVPKKLQTDQGKEFLNSLMNKFLSDRNVILFFTDQELKAQIVERFNRTIRSKITKDCAHRHSMRYVDVLPRLVDGYNHSIHSSTKYAPFEVNEENERAVFDSQYGAYLEHRRKKHKLKIGDNVRAMAWKSTFAKDKPTFEEEIFKIIDCLHTDPPTYKLMRLSSGFVVKGAYYENQLQKIWPAPSAAATETSTTSNNDA